MYCYYIYYSICKIIISNSHEHKLMLCSITHLNCTLTNPPSLDKLVVWVGNIFHFHYKKLTLSPYFQSLLDQSLLSPTPLHSLKFSSSSSSKTHITFLIFLSCSRSWFNSHFHPFIHVLFWAIKTWFYMCFD